MDSKSNVKVILRARPMNDREIREDLGKTCISLIADKDLVFMNTKQDQKSFVFDFVADGTVN
jgi:hypothetical protein